MHLLADAHVNVIVASQDGMLFATVQDTGKALCIWDAMTGEYRSTLILPREAFQAFTSLAWSPDGRFLAGSTKLGQVFVWNVGTRTLVSVYRGHYSSVNAVSWSQDGTSLASASDDGSIHVWTMHTKDAGLPLCLFKSNEAFEVVWSPDGSHLASCWRDGGVRIWSTRTWRCIYTYRGHTSAVRSCAWSSDGTRLVSAGEDDTVQVWRVPVGDQHWYRFLGIWGIRLTHLIPPFSSDSSVKIVRWSPDGSAIAAMSEDGVCIWDSTRATRLANFSGRSLRSFSWFRGGTHLIVVHGHPLRCQSWHWQEALVRI